MLCHVSNHPDEVDRIRALEPRRPRAIRSGVGYGDRDSMTGIAVASIDERGDGSRHVDGPKGSEAQCPTSVELLAEAVRDGATLQIVLVICAPLVTRCALEGGIETIPAVVDGADRQLVWNRTGLHWNSVAHRSVIDVVSRAIERWRRSQTIA